MGFGPGEEGGRKRKEHSHIKSKDLAFATWKKRMHESLGVYVLYLNITIYGFKQTNSDMRDVGETVDL